MSLSPDGRRFELEQLQLILRSHADREPDELCDATFADLAAYQRDAEQVRRYDAARYRGA